MRLRRFLSFLAVSVLIAGGVAAAPTTAQADDTVVTGMDPVFQACLNVKHLGRADAAAPLTITDLNSVTSIVECGRTNYAAGTNDGYTGIASLTGAEHLTRIHSLSVAHGTISDLSPLSSLTLLSVVGLRFNQITDLSPLKGNPSISYLQLNNNQIETLSELTDLPNLDNLDISDNPISDLGTITGLTNIATLTMHHNHISDLSPITALPNLRILGAIGNMITDITPLTHLPHLTTLYLSGNEISDLSPLDSSPSLNDPSSYVDATRQLAAATAFLGTYSVYDLISIPSSLAGSMTFSIHSGPASVDNTAGTITYHEPGEVTLDWQSGESGEPSVHEFQGRVEITVTEGTAPEEPGDTPTTPETPGDTPTIEIPTGGSLSHSSPGPGWLVLGLLLASGALILRRSTMFT